MSVPGITSRLWISRFGFHQKPLSDVIPNLLSAGGQEGDLTSACANDAVGQRCIQVHALISVLITSVVIHPHRKVPPPPAFSVRVRDDIMVRVGIIRNSEVIEEIMPVPTAFHERTLP